MASPHNRKSKCWSWLWTLSVQRPMLSRDCEALRVVGWGQYIEHGLSDLFQIDHLICPTSAPHCLVAVGAV